MVVLLFVYTLLLSSLSHAQECNREAVREQMKFIVQNYTYRDVSRYIDMTKKDLQACKIDNRNMGVSDNFLESLKTASTRAEMARIKDDIKNFSENGRIEMFETEYRLYAKRVGLGQAETDAFLKQYKEEGVKSAARERKTCTGVDMSKEMGPVRNQDSIGWCYAFAGADLVSYRLKKKVSAADMAVTYNDGVISDIQKTFGSTAEKFQGGFTASAIDDAAKKGFCLEKDFPSEDNSRSNLKNTLKEIDSLGRQKLGIAGADCVQLHQASRVLFPNVKMPDLQKVLSESSSRNFIDNLADKTCNPRIKANLETESNMYIFDKKAMIRDLDEQLNKSNPVALGYDASNLMDRRDTEKTQMHASVIVGRRFNEKSGQCEYLLRNSWGRGCSYDTAYECKEGNIWIPKNDIMQRGKFLDYVK